MPKRKPGEREGDAPRTDLPPTREPYYEGYFGTDEEEGVVREEESGDEERDEPTRGATEDAAGGDREIMI
jgi:hypothetical protein